MTREPVDRTSRLLLQSLGQPDPEVWISAEASVIYGGHRSPLRATLPEWTSRVTLPDGRPAILDHHAAAENAAARQLAEYRAVLAPIQLRLALPAQPEIPRLPRPTRRATAGFPIPAASPSTASGTSSAAKWSRR